MVEKGYSGKPGCMIKVSVYDGKEETVCGTYTGKPDIHRQTGKVKAVFYLIAWDDL